jgi:tellurite resistance protein
MIELLNTDEQRVMLELLLHIANSDGTVKDVEQEILENYATLVDLDFSTINGNLTPADLIPQIPSAVSRAIVLQELLRMSHLDGIISQGENAAILAIAGQMGFPDSVVHRLDEWVVEGLRWVWNGEDILDEIEAEFEV